MEIEVLGALYSYSVSDKSCWKIPKLLSAKIVFEFEGSMAIARVYSVLGI
jgi:hypothetical protein